MATKNKNICTRTITEIIIHCTATKEFQDIKAVDVDRWHKQLGWKCIGYNYLIDLDGTIENGRDINMTGAHTVGHNTHSIGVCYVGGLDENGKAKDTRTPEQKLALQTLIVNLKRMFPNAKIYGHRQFANKACPCFDVPAWCKEVGIDCGY